MSFLDYDEDLNVNEFFVHLKDVSTPIFKDASTKRYTICVPRQGSFDVKALTPEIVSTHILKTRLDHHDIRASINTYSGKEVKLSNGNLETISGFEHDRKVKVLFEEDYVNEADHSYKVLCVDRPLEGDSWSHVVNGELFTQRLTTQEQCMDFLWSSNRKSRIKRKIDLLVSPVINSISDAKSSDEVLNSCQGLYGQALGLLRNHPYYRKNCRENYYFAEAVQLSLETYLMGLLHDSVFTKLYNLEKSAEIEFNKQYLHYSDKVTYKTLQLDRKHCVNLERSAGEVEQVVRQQCPLEMAYCLDKAFNLLSYSSPRKQSTGSTRRTTTISSMASFSPPGRRQLQQQQNFQPAFFPRSESATASIISPHSSAPTTTSSPFHEPRTETVVFSADQLLPLMVLLILNSRIPCWLTIINYLKNYRLSETSNSRLGYAITCFEAAIEIIKSGELKRDYEREQLLAETALSSSRSNNPLHNLQGKHSRNFDRSKNSQQNGGNSSRISNSKSTSSDTWSSSSLQPLGSSSDDRDSGVASDDVILTSNIDDVESNLQTSSIDGCDTIKTPSTEDNQVSRHFSDPDIGQIGEVLTNGYHNSEGKAAENEGKQSVFDEDSISLTLSVSSSINRLFKLIKEDKRNEMKELLETEKDTLIEKLCHPLCTCAKCERIKGTSGGNSSLSTSSSESFSERTFSEKISSSTRDENGWTALHAAAFYGNQFALEKLINLDYAVSSKNNQGLTPLHLACIEGHQNICMLLLYYGAPVNAVDKNGNTGLHIACVKGNFHVVTALLYQPGAAEPLNVNAQNVMQETPLFLAAKFGYIDIVRELLDFGADVSLENSMGEGPIQICMDSDIRELLLGGSQTALNKLSEERFQLVNEQLLNDYDDSLTNDYSPTASVSSHSIDKFSFSNISHPSHPHLHPNSKTSRPRRDSRGGQNDSTLEVPELESTVSRGSAQQKDRLGVLRSDVVSRSAKSEGSNPMSTQNSATDFGIRKTTMDWRRSRFAKSQSYTCLSSEHQNPSWFYAHLNKDSHDRKLRLLLQRVRSNEIDKVLFLLGAAIKGEGEGQPTLYTHSLCHPKCDCDSCEQLRKEAREPPHRYAVTVNSQSDPTEGGLSPLHAAVISGLPEMCVVLLNQGANVDLHAPPSMNTPLHFACQYNRAEIASLLFEYGAKGNIPNREQNTALHLAASCGHEWPVNLLSSVLSSASLSSRNRKGDTPLHLAASQGYAQITKCLLDSGADPNLRNELSFTPLECAVLNNHPKPASLLSSVTSNANRHFEELQLIYQDYRASKNSPGKCHPDVEVNDVANETMHKMSIVEVDGSSVVETKPEEDSKESKPVESQTESSLFERGTELFKNAVQVSSSAGATEKVTQMKECHEESI